MHTLTHLSLLAAFTATLGAQTSEFIADPMPTASCHATTVIEVRPGELMAAWFGGTAEGRPDVAIWGARRQNGHWQAPVELVREPNIATYNPRPFPVSRPSPVAVLQIRDLPHSSGPPAGFPAATMAEPGLHRSTFRPAFTAPIRAKPLVLPSGVIVSGTSVESYHSWAAWIERSADNGKTWTRHGPIQSPPPPAQAADANHGIIQPVVVPVEGKHLRIYARSTATISRIVMADSFDEGLTWTAGHVTDLPNPSSGIDTVRLKDGRYVMIYNHTDRGRTPLNLAVSADGEHWQMFHALETDPGEYSYPAMIQGTDGSLNITYTWRRQKIKYVNWPLAEIPKV